MIRGLLGHHSLSVTVWWAQYPRPGLIPPITNTISDTAISRKNSYPVPPKGTLVLPALAEQEFLHGVPCGAED